MGNDIVFEKVSYTYNMNSPFEYTAIQDVSFYIPENKVTAIIGHTGSGKSTLLQHFNVLVKPTRGKVVIAGESVTNDTAKKSYRQLRKKVGVVFQFPESQLFEETVLKDVMFGPLNFGVTEDEAERIAKEKLSLVGIEPSLYERSPFELSGGQMRRVAIAGVLALEPEILVLDEPTAGLDPMGHQYMLEMFMQLQQQQALTLVMVTHHMEDVAKYADHVIVMNEGRVINQGEPKVIFQETEWLQRYRLDVPQTVRWMRRIEEASGQNIMKTPLTITELVEQLVALKEV